MTGRPASPAASPRPRRFPLRAAALAAVGVIVLAAGCAASPRNALNTTASSCFKGIPQAKFYVQDKGKVVGVRQIPKKFLVRRVPALAQLKAKSVCVVAFKGDFKPGDVADTAGAQGRYAIVVLDDHGEKVLHAFIVARLPVRFRHQI